MSDAELLMISSHQARAAAEEVRTSPVPRRLQNGVRVTEPQLLAIATLLEDAEPVVIDQPRTLASTSERPGFIDARAQPADGLSLVFHLGILPRVAYRITTDGRVCSA